MEPHFRTYDTCFAKLEKWSNIAGYFFGFFTGSLRILVGKVQFVAGLIFASVSFGMYIFSKTQNQKYLDWAWHSSGYVTHGMANILRGIVETFSLSGSFLILFTYDFFVGRFHYSNEPLGSVISLNPYHESRKEKKACH